MKLADIMLFELGGQPLVGVHYSQRPNLKVLKADRWNNGDGLKGAERSRAESYPDHFVDKRIYFYIDGSKYTKEQGLGANEYKVKLTNLYDWDADPKDFYKKAAQLAHDEYASEQKQLMKKTMGIDDYEVDEDHYDSRLATTIMEELIKKNGYNGYFSKSSNGNIVYFHDVPTGK